MKQKEESLEVRAGHPVDGGCSFCPERDLLTIVVGPAITGPIVRFCLDCMTELMRKSRKLIRDEF